MEITLEFEDFDFRDNEQVDQVCNVRRSIFQRFPNAIWERCKNGHRITI